MGKVDALFPNRRGAQDKTIYAFLRLLYPTGLTTGAKHNFRAYLGNRARRITLFKHLLETRELEWLAKAEELGLLEDQDILQLIDHATAAEDSRAADWLLGLRRGLTDDTSSKNQVSPQNMLVFVERLEASLEACDAAALAAAIEGGAHVSWRPAILARAAQLGSVDCVRTLLLHEAPVGERDGTGVSPLDYAVRNGNLVMVKLLLEHKAVASKGGRYTDVEGGVHHVDSPLRQAVNSGQVEIVEVILAIGDTPSAKLAVEALEAAVESGMPRMLGAILAGIDQFEFMSRALAKATALGRVDMALMLAASGAKLDYTQSKHYKDLDFGMRKQYRRRYSIETSRPDHTYTADYRNFLFTAYHEGDFTHYGTGIDPAPVEDRIAVLTALHAEALLSEPDRDALLARALYFDEPSLARWLVEQGADINEAFAPSERILYDCFLPVRPEPMGAGYGDYLWRGISPETAALICEQLQASGERVMITAALLKDDWVPIELLVTLTPFCDGEHCENKVALMRRLAGADQAGALAAMESWGVFTKKNLDEAIKSAIENKATRASAYLLDCKERLFGAGDKLSL
jgi:hypothetical protein